MKLSLDGTVALFGGHFYLSQYSYVLDRYVIIDRLTNPTLHDRINIASIKAGHYMEEKVIWQVNVENQESQKVEIPVSILGM